MIEQGTDAWRLQRCGLATGVTVRRCHGDRQNRRISGSPQLPRAACVRAADRQSPSKRTATAPCWLAPSAKPDARALYQVRTRRLVDEAGFVRIEGMAAGASPDGLIGDDGLLEIKCPNPATHIDYLRLPVGECPKAYFWQVQGQMLATGRAWCDFVSYHPEFPRRVANRHSPRAARPASAGKTGNGARQVPRRS